MRDAFYALSYRQSIKLYQDGKANDRKSPCLWGKIFSQFRRLRESQHPKHRREGGGRAIPIPHRFLDDVICRELTVEEIHTYIRKFAEAAAVCKRRDSTALRSMPFMKDICWTSLQSHSTIRGRMNMAVLWQTDSGLRRRSCRRSSRNAARIIRFPSDTVSRVS